MKIFGETLARIFNSRLYHLVKKEFLQLSRDKQMMFFVLIMPVIQLTFFGYVLSTDIRHIPLAVYDEDNRAFSRLLTEKFSQNGYFDLVARLDKSSQMSPAIDSGRAKVLLHFPPDFSRNLEDLQPTRFQTVVDGSDANSATIGLGYIQGITARFNEELLAGRLPKHSTVPQIDPRVRIWFNPDMKTMNYMVPGLLAQILLILTMQLTSLAIVKERELGTLEQLLVSPLRPIELLIGKTLPFIIISYFSVIMITLIAVFWFKVALTGSFLLLLLLTLLFMFASIGLGLFVSTISQTQQQASQTSQLIAMPSMLLSGFIFPIASMPLIFQWLTLLIPMRYYLVIVRGIFLKGIGIQYLWSQVWPLLVLGIGIFTLAAVRFNKKLG